MQRLCVQTPGILGAPDHVRELGGIDKGKSAVAVVQKDRDRAVQPGSRDDHIGDVIAIDITSGKLKAADGGGDAKGLPSAARELNANPILGLRGSDATSLHRGQVSPLIAVKVRDREIGIDFSSRKRQEGALRSGGGAREAYAAKKEEQTQARESKDSPLREASAEAWPPNRSESTRNPPASEDGEHAKIW